MQERNSHPSHASRRHFVGCSAKAIAASVAAGITVVGSGVRSSNAQTTDGPLKKLPGDNVTMPLKFRPRYCLNMSTINSSQVPVREQVKIAADAGYHAVELWMRDVDKFAQEGGKLAELRSEIADLGLAVDSAIAFGNWIAEDASVRKKGLEQAKRDMETLHAIGGSRIAAPPVGATKGERLDLNRVADRYRTLLEIGSAQGIVPQLELWGFSKNLATLEELLFVAAAAQHPDACILLDVYHMYKGGSDFTNAGFIPGTRTTTLHMNDYPSSPPRAEISDKDRVYPGDGIAPIGSLLRTMVGNGFHGTLSLELFNRDYWKLPPDQVAKAGLAKMKAVVEAAFPA